MRVLILGCGATKLHHAAPAKDLYTGCLFKSRRRYAESTGCPWFIFSAKHHAVDPNQVIEPYDTSPPKPRDEYNCWSINGRNSIAAYLADKLNIEIGPNGRWANPQLVTLEFHMGEVYYRAIAPKFKNEGFQVIIPTQGMGQGTQMKFYSQIKQTVQQILI